MSNLDIKLNFVGQPYGMLGIPIHTRDLAREVISQAPETSIYPLFPQAANDPYDITSDLSSVLKPLYIDTKLSGIVFIFWTPDMYQKILSLVADRAKTLVVGYFIFEWTKLSKQHIDGINAIDYVAVPSEWHRQVLLDNGINENKIIILQAGVNPAFLLNYDVERNHKFLFVGKYETRKCVDELVSSFVKTITPEMGSLTFLCRDPHSPDWDVVEYLKTNGVSNINVADRPANPREMAKLYAAHQYILIPSRAGGIELPLIESQAQGCVPIVTRASGMQHYMPTDYYKWFIPVKEMVPIYDNRWFSPTIDWGEWAVPDFNAFEELLKKASISSPVMHSDMLRIRAATEFSYPLIVSALLTWMKLAYKRKCSKC